MFKIEGRRVVFTLPFNHDSVAGIRLSGVIHQRGLCLAKINEDLERAFEGDYKAVALLINCPGGSPAQTALLAERIRSLALKSKKKVYAFVEDVAASGGYWLASVADEVYALPTSLVGSIGVISAGFGFQDMIQKLGIERRVYTSGDHKSRLDPFKPEKKDDIKWLGALQEKIYTTFQNTILENRKGKIQGDPAALFNGDVFLGEDALQNGLIDGFGDVYTKIQQDFGDKIKLKILNEDSKSFMKKWLKIQKPSGIVDVMDSVYETLHWNHYGLN
jgi:signal peptide peptidase SppA